VTLAEAFTILATSGCRLVPDAETGIALVVPEGTTVPAELLEVMRAHRQQLVAAHATPVATASPAALADDLGDYLREKGIADSIAELVVHAARLFNVPGQAITIEQVVADAEPELFEPGIPVQTTIATRWHKPGAGYFEVPAGSLGLLVPQLWAIPDAAARCQVESTIAHAKRQRKIVHVPIWLAGETRAIGMDAITLEGAVAPAGMDLTPWRAGAAA
jgi:hypothetical protein